jgi:hypothetical protein
MSMAYDYSSTCVYLYIYDNSMVVWENARRFVRLFLPPLQPHELHPNPLPILARAVNTVRVHRPLRIPCWRKGRWKSLT